MYLYCHVLFNYAKSPGNLGGSYNLCKIKKMFKLPRFFTKKARLHRDFVMTIVIFT